MKRLAKIIASFVLMSFVVSAYADFTCSDLANTWQGTLNISSNGGSPDITPITVDITNVDNMGFLTGNVIIDETRYVLNHNASMCNGQMISFVNQTSGIVLVYSPGSKINTLDFTDNTRINNKNVISGSSLTAE